MNKRRKLSEFEHFNQLAREWWSEDGRFKTLHKLTPIRIKYILDNIKTKNIKNLKILDLGCGGGLICEPLSRLGAKITGVDFAENNIKVAKLHAKKNNLQINYLIQDIENLTLKNKFDIIILFEVLEHIDEWQFALNKIKKNLKQNGLLILSTINRNLISNVFAIKIAENFLKWIPKNTHNYNKLITPYELDKILKKENFTIVDLCGLIFNPLTNEWKLNKYNKLINYFCVAKLN